MMKQFHKIIYRPIELQFVKGPVNIWNIIQIK